MMTTQNPADIDCMQLLALLADIRAACGDNGRRMQDELVEYIATLHDTLSVIADPRAELPHHDGCSRERIYEDMAQAALTWTTNTRSDNEPDI